MDIVSHALTGAIVGASYNHPIIGALCAVIPDCTLGLKRRKKPPFSYKLFHNVSVCFVLGAAGYFLMGDFLIFWAILSHIALDIPTHSTEWAPTLLHPNQRSLSIHILSAFPDAHSVKVELIFKKHQVFVKR